MNYGARGGTYGWTDRVTKVGVFWLLNSTENGPFTLIVITRRTQHREKCLLILVSILIILSWWLVMSVSRARGPSYPRGVSPLFWYQLVSSCCPRSTDWTSVRADTNTIATLPALRQENTDNTPTSPDSSFCLGASRSCLVVPVVSGYPSLSCEDCGEFWWKVMDDCWLSNKGFSAAIDKTLIVIKTGECDYYV